MAGKHQKRGAAAAAVFAALALLAAAAAAYLGLGKAFLLQLTVDSSQLSPTLSGVMEREQIDLESTLAALETDEELRLDELLDTDGPVRTRLARLSALLEELRARFRLQSDGGASLIGTELGKFDRACAQVQTAAGELTQLLTGAQTVRWILTALAAAGLLASLLLLLFGRGTGAATLCAFTALGIGALPLALLAAAKTVFAQLASGLAVPARYGIGVKATLRLTKTGMAQVLFAAAAMMLAACSRMVRLYAERRRRRRTVKRQS